MRLLISFLLATGVSLAIFVGMEKMTSSKNMKQLESDEIPQLIYLRESKDTHINEKKRIKPKKPEPEKPQKLHIKTPKMQTKVEKNVKIQSIVTPNIDLSSISSLSGAKINVSMGLIDANTLVKISAPPPRYPRRAKLTRKEGSVTIQFQIDANGNVHNPVVVESNPEGLFDKAALRAIKRWRFKPRKGADSQNMMSASQTMNFRLAK